MDKMDKWLYWIAAIVFILVAIEVIVFICGFVGMYIDHQCYQLQPNDNYNHTICERYWNR